MSFGVYPLLTKDYILKRLSQERIMEKYLGIPVKLDELVISPLRNDDNPTCSFYYNKYGRLRFRDFSGHFWGDCFDVVAFRLNLDSKDKKAFQFILHTIAKDFRIHKYEHNGAITEYNLRTDFFFKKKKHKKPVIFKITFREFNYHDRAYWGQYNISQALLARGHVYFAQAISISKDDLPFTEIYRYSPKDPAYCYYGGKYPNGVLKWKIYYPIRKARGDVGFHSNASFLQGSHLITCGRVGIVTKSFKDVLTFASIGLQAVAPGAESVLLTPPQYWYLNTKFDFLVSCMDYDRAGMISALEHRRRYNIQPFMFTDGRFGTLDYGAKDASDYVKAFGADNFVDIIRSIYDSYKLDLEQFDIETYNNLKFIQ